MAGKQNFEDSNEHKPDFQAMYDTTAKFYKTTRTLDRVQVTDHEKRVLSDLAAGPHPKMSTMILPEIIDSPTRDLTSMLTSQGCPMIASHQWSVPG